LKILRVRTKIDERRENKKEKKRKEKVVGFK